MYQRPRARTYAAIYLSMPSSEFRIKFHPPRSPLLSSLSIFSGAERANRGRKEGESERLSHQLIKSLTADSSWGLAAAAGGGGGGGGEQTDIAWCQKNGGKKHDAKSAVFCRRDDDDATRGEEAQFY